MAKFKRPTLKNRERAVIRYRVSGNNTDGEFTLEYDRMNEADKVARELCKDSAGVKIEMFAEVDMGDDCVMRLFSGDEICYEWIEEDEE